MLMPKKIVSFKLIITYKIFPTNKIGGIKNGDKLIEKYIKLKTKKVLRSKKLSKSKNLSNLVTKKDIWYLIAYN